MTKRAQEIVCEALTLPPETRAFIAEKLIESLDVKDQFVLSPEWQKEIEKRCREIDEGSVELRDADEVFEEAFASLKR